MPTVTIVGIGRAGGALALALNAAGVNVERLVYRSSKPGIEIADVLSWDELSEVGSDVLIIASADPEIRPIAERIASFERLPEVALHLSGSLSSSELGSLRDKGVAIGSMHPLVSLSDAVTGSKRFSGSYFCVEGDEPAVYAANKLVTSLKGTPFSIPTGQKALYHASAVTASGHVTALIDIATEMLSKCGLSMEDAQMILLPLIESTVDNLRTQDPAHALTGTFARGDTEAFQRHLDAFDQTVSDSIRKIYLELAQRSVKIASRNAVGSADYDEIAKAISMAKAKRGC